MKKILVIHHGSGIGGGLIALVSLIDKLKSDFEIKVLCIYNSTAVDYLRKRDIDVEVVDGFFYRSYYDLFVHSEANFVNVPNLIRSFKNIILYLCNMIFFSKGVLAKYRADYDILYLNSAFLSDWLFWGNKFFRKNVIHVREPLARGWLGIRRAFIRSIIDKFSDHIVAVSKDNASRLNLSHKTILLYDPVLKRPVKGVNLDTNFKYFVYVGGSQRIKGFADLINCLEYLDHHIKIIFIGPTSELDELEQSISFKIRRIFSNYLKNEIPLLKEKYINSVNLIKIGTTDNVFDYYTSSMAIIAPFAKPHACLPILEAMSIGKCVIVSNVDGMDEFVSSLPFKSYSQGNARELADQINSFSKISNAEGDKLASEYLEEYSNLLNKQNRSLKEIINELKKN